LGRALARRELVGDLRRGDVLVRRVGLIEDLARRVALHRIGGGCEHTQLVAPAAVALVVACLDLDVVKGLGAQAGEGALGGADDFGVEGGGIGDESLLGGGVQEVADLCCRGIVVKAGQPLEINAIAKQGGGGDQLDALRGLAAGLHAALEPLGDGIARGAHGSLNRFALYGRGWSV
jgi:hypothetical protein